MDAAANCLRSAQQAAHDAGNEAVQIRWVNGSLEFALAGGHNHVSGDIAISTGRASADLAPGSYGIVHLDDDEADPAVWWRYVMSKDEVSKQQETSLNPHFGVVED